MKNSAKRAPVSRRFALPMLRSQPLRLLRRTLPQPAAGMLQAWDGIVHGSPIAAPLTGPPSPAACVWAVLLGDAQPSRVYHSDWQCLEATVPL